MQWCNSKVGTKKQYSFPGFDFDKVFEEGYLKEKIERSNLPSKVKHHLRDLNVVLLNSYYRHYYATIDERFRVTLDTGLSFFRVKRLNNQFAHKQIDHRNIVLELKYNINQDTSF